MSIGVFTTALIRKMTILTAIKRRWDSSDPDRAPPPLPLAPSMGTPTTKANTSAGIAAAAKAIVEKARESAPLSSYTSNRASDGMPERSLVKGAHHKRMQSLQSSPVKDLRNYLENNRSPERSPERPGSRSSYAPYSRMSSIEDLSPSTPTPAERDSLKDTPTLRPTSRRPILGENTPPSATMLALQTMQVPDPPLGDITNGNGPSTPGGSRIHTAYDFSSQLLNLTTIATSLQKEMHQLSRRSKDNATDLLTLKQATNSRDEDIRKSLRDLANTVSTQTLLGPPPPFGGKRTDRSMSHSQFLESKPFSSPPSASKTFNSVPRAASAHGFLDDSRCESPSPYSIEGAASVAMLEKIIREMVTKDGQDRLLDSLSTLLEKSGKDNKEAVKKVEELSDFIRTQSGSQALVHVRGASSDEAPKLDFSFDTPKAKSAERSDSDHDEILKMLQRVKDSILHSGGTTSEVKGLVRDLRGEVLGMGRELGKKLDQIGDSHLTSTLDRSINDGRDSDHLEEVQRIVEEGIAELKQNLASMLKDRASQDDDSFKQLTVARSGPDNDEMLAVVQRALSEHSKNAKTDEPEVEMGLNREAVLDAVKDGLKDFEPNIELQQFGLERDEILSVLKEGLEEYRSDPANSTGPVQIDKGDVYEVMQEALKNFEAPYPAEQLAQLREELIGSVRDALDNFQPPPTESPMDHAAMQAMILETVKEGLVNHGPAAPREIEISRDDLFDAVKASLDGSTIPFGGFGEQVLTQMKDLIDNMRVEFKQYSAANGRDTEQVLDAVKDGLESLRAEIEQYVDRAQDVTGKDEIVDTVKGGLEQLREDVRGFCAEGPSHDMGRAEMLEYIKSEFEHLHGAVQKSGSTRDLEGSDAGQPTAVMIALREGFDDLKGHLDNRHEDMSSNEEINEAMKEEFDQLKAAIINAHNADKSELIETIQDSMGALHARVNGSELSGLSSGAVDDVINSMREELSTLKESIHAMISDIDQEGISGTVRREFEDLRTQMLGDQNDASSEALAAVKQELEAFRESLGSALVVGGTSGERSLGGEHNETLDAIRTAVDEVKETMEKRETDGISTEQLEAIRGEFENLRNSIATSVVHGGNNEEVLDAVRLGLDDLRSHIERKLDNPDTAMEHHSQVLDAINEGLESLRGDITKTLDKPVDQTVHYEILDTLKEGLAGLRSEMDKLTSGQPIAPQGGQIVLADGAPLGQTRELSPEDVAAAEAASGTQPLNGASLDRVEFLLAQLQIKIEAMDHNVQDLPSQQFATRVPDGIALKEDLTGMESMIRELQESVAAMHGKNGEPAPDSAARKEDTDAIETLLRNTKAHLEEMSLPDQELMASKEHLEEVHTAVQMANDVLQGLSDKLENSVAAKSDTAVIEVLALDIKMMLEEAKEKQAADEDDEKPALMTKADLDVLGVICTEIKTHVTEMELPDPENLPSKADIEQLQGLISDFRESHDKMRDSYETDIAVTAKAFDDRKQEFEDTITQLGEVKTVLAEVRVELMDKLIEGEAGVNTLGETLKSIEERIGSEDILFEVREVMEKLKGEFERTHTSIEAVKVDHAASAETVLEKQSEHRSGVVTELSEKLDLLFDGMMSKYDDAQTAAAEQAKVMEEKAAQQQELLDNTKTMAEDLRLSIDTLGTTMTSFIGDLPAQVQQMTEESKTVFAQAEATHKTLEETSEALKSEHTATREGINKVLAAVDVVQNDITEHNPRFMVTLEEVRALIREHYDHSQSTSAAAAEQAQAVKDLQDALKAGFEESRSHQADGFKSHQEELQRSLPSLMPPSSDVPAPSEKYDDAAVHEKLDKLMDHVHEASERSTHLDRLDEIHEKVMSTAAEVTAFVAAQNMQIQNEHNSKEKEAEEVALLLERRLERKDQIEADITVLNEEKESLQAIVEQLKAEKEALAAQKSRLNADMSSMETALHIRRDELHEMDEKAAAIERRMLEGVMNQSRMLLLAKTKVPAPKKKPQGRDLRIPSDASAMSAHTVTSTVSPLKGSHALVMKPRPGLARMANTPERRIMSLNQISHNAPTGPQGFAAEKASLITGLGNMKRSHSVKNTFAPRKASWNHSQRIASVSEADKENNDISDDEDETIHDAETLSEAGTTRRQSYMSGTDSYATGSYMDDAETPVSEDGHRQSGYAPSDATFETGSYLTGSYLTGSEIDHRSSLGSTVNGTVGGQESEAGLGADRDEDGMSELSHLPRSELSTVPEGTEATQSLFDGGDAESEVSSVAPLRATHSEIEAAVREVMKEEGLKGIYAPQSDSGLGTDCPTAACMSGGEEYFK